MLACRHEGITRKVLEIGPSKLTTLYDAKQCHPRGGRKPGDRPLTGGTPCWACTQHGSLKRIEGLACRLREGQALGTIFWVQVPWGRARPGYSQSDPAFPLAVSVGCYYFTEMPELDTARCATRTCRTA